MNLRVRSVTGCSLSAIMGYLSPWCQYAIDESVDALGY